MRTTLLCLTLILGVSSQAIAAPNKIEANKWLTEFRAAHDKKGDALFLNDAAKRRTLMQTLMKLRDKSEKIFGVGSDCNAAADGMVSIWQAEIELTTGALHPNMTASSLANLAWEAGQKYGACRDMIDSIK